MKPPPDGPGLIDVLVTILSPLIAGVLLVACVVGAAVRVCSGAFGRAGGDVAGFG